MAMDIPMSADQCDVPGCDEPMVAQVGDEQKCAVHALAKYEAWALAQDWKSDLLEANVQISEAIDALGKGNPEDAWASWTEAFALLRIGHETKRTLILRGLFEEAGH